MQLQSLHNYWLKHNGMFNFNKTATLLQDLRFTQQCYQKHKFFSHTPNEQNHLSKCVIQNCALKSKARSWGPVNRHVTHLDFYT